MFILCLCLKFPFTVKLVNINYEQEERVNKQDNDQPTLT